MEKIQTITIRLKPGQDLKSELDQLAAVNELEAACVLTCVGSLTTVVLRFANQDHTDILEGHFEIVFIDRCSIQARIALPYLYFRRTRPDLRCAFDGRLQGLYNCRDRDRRGRWRQLSADNVYTEWLSGVGCSIFVGQFLTKHLYI